MAILQDSVTLGIVVVLLTYAIAVYGIYLMYRIEDERPTESINPGTPAEVREEEVGRLPLSGD